MCPNSEQVHAYHDGELPGELRAGFESHLVACAECRELLADLQRLTGAFQQVPLSEIPPRMVGRLYGAWHLARAAQDRGVRKLAGWMTAAAAAVVLGLFIHRSNPTSQAPDVPSAGNGWVDTVALMPPPEPRDGSNADLVQFAQWMASDLSFNDTQ